MNNVDILSKIQKALYTDIDTKNQFLSLVESYPNSFFDRNNENGHITGSMLVFNESGDKVLLTHHRKFDKWLQLGGHNDIPGQTIFQTAQREMEEEAFDNKTVDFTLLSEAPINLDIHRAGTHLHFDMCFASIVSESEEIKCSSESKSIEWRDITELMSEDIDQRLRFMIKNSLTNFAQRFKIQASKKLSP